MNRNEMLKKLHLTEHELKDLLEKFHVFQSSLNKDQREAVHRSLPRLEEAQKSFGPGVTTADLQAVFCSQQLKATTICEYFLASTE